MLNSFTQTHNTPEAVYHLFETNYSSTKTGNSNKILSMNVNMTSISIDKYIYRWAILFYRNWWKLLCLQITWSTGEVWPCWQSPTFWNTTPLGSHDITLNFSLTYFSACSFQFLLWIHLPNPPNILLFTGTLKLTYLLLLSLIMASSATSTISKSSQNLSPELQILFPNWKLDTRTCPKHPKLSTVTCRGLVFKLETPKLMGSFSALCYFL